MGHTHRPGYMRPFRIIVFFTGNGILVYRIPGGDDHSAGHRWLENIYSASIAKTLKKTIYYDK